MSTFSPFGRACLVAVAVALASTADASRDRQPANAQAPEPQASSPPALTFADLADLALTAPVVAHVRLRRAQPLRPAEAVGVAAGHRRFYVEADLVALIRGAPATPAVVRYLVDLPNDSRGRPARPARQSAWLVLANAVPGRPGELQLVARDAQLAYTPALAERLRGIVRAGLEPTAPPPITGIGRAFHVPGALTGASETQFFLQTARRQPVSITVAREPNAEPRWFVSLSEFVDAGAARPERDTLLWYRLACFLPAALPRAATADAAEHAAAIAADYRLVRAGLGACERTRPRG